MTLTGSGRMADQRHAEVFKGVSVFVRVGIVLRRLVTTVDGAAALMTLSM
jgi:hypothetical protein